MEEEKKADYKNRVSKISIRYFVQDRLIISHLFWTCVVCRFNPLCTGRLLQCYMLEESICHFRGIGSILFYF